MACEYPLYRSSIPQIRYDGVPFKDFSLHHSLNSKPNLSLPESSRRIASDIQHEALNFDQIFHPGSYCYSCPHSHRTPIPNPRKARRHNLWSVGYSTDGNLRRISRPQGRICCILWFPMHHRDLSLWQHARLVHKLDMGWRT